MPDESTSPEHRVRIPGLDPDATPMVSIGLGLTGLLLGLRPRLAAWPLALTAAAALLYRDPERSTPDAPGALFAPADGLVTDVEELYEHRFLHTDAVRLTIMVSPLHVPVQRCPATGTVSYLEYVLGEPRATWDMRSGDPEHGACQYIGISTDWGPVLLAISASALTRRIICRVGLGDYVEAGSRLSTVRFGARVDLLLPRDVVEGLPHTGEQVQAGITRIGSVVPL